MNNRNFDRDDARKLAEFAGLGILRSEEPIRVVIPEKYCYGSGEGSGIFRPWDWRTNQWNRQVLLDAVREKGFEDEYMEELSLLLDLPSPPVPSSALIDFASAPPEAICSAILSLEVE